MKIIGNIIKEYNSVESTNMTANELISNKEIKEGAVIVSGFQQHGKGQESNSWESEAGKNLTLSVLLSPTFLLPEKQFVLNKIVSLAIADFIRSMLPKLKVRIKWPNDIYVKHQKIAGILINNIIQGSTIENSIVGIGININQRSFMSNAPNPVSLTQLSGFEYDLKNCLKLICEALDKWYKVLRDGNFELIDNEYLASLYQFGNYHKYRIEHHVLKAKIIGVSKYGNLMLESDKKEMYTCDLKEVEFILRS